MPDYFALADLRELPQMGDSSRYTAELVDRAASYITGIIEREVGTSFIGRPVVNGPLTPSPRGDALIAESPHILSVSAVRVDGAAVTSGTFSALGSLIYRRVGGVVQDWPESTAETFGGVRGDWVAGYSSTPPSDIREAAMQGTRARLLTTASSADYSDRRTSLSTDQGTINFVIAGPDRPTGYPEVDAVIMGWARKLSVFGFA